MREQSCCFTGHRSIPFLQRIRVIAELNETISELIRAGVTRFYAGGARGFDTLAAKAVLNAKKSHPEVKLILLMPCQSQARFWKEAEIAEYEKIKGCADEVHYTSKEYTKSCMFKRNRALVDSTSICVCFWEKDAGGTAYTVQYANSKGLRIINLAKNSASVTNTR